MHVMVSLKPLSSVRKLWALILLTASLQTIAQGPARPITLDLKDAPLEKAFAEIGRQSGYLFFYKLSMIPEFKNVDVSLKNVPLQQALDEIFSSQSFSYNIVKKTIAVTRTQGSDTKTDGSSNTITIIGRVTDSLTGKPVEGANVVIKDKRKGVVTDKDGKFMIPVPDAPGIILVVSHIAYEKKELSPKPEGMNEVVLTPAAKKMEDVVVNNGIFSRKIKTYTGAAHTITAEDIKKVGNQNIFNILAVLDPSVRIQQDLLNGSDPNKVPDIRIRGASSLPITTDITNIGTNPTTAEKDMYNAYGKKVDNIRNTYKVNPNTPLFVLDGFEVPLQRIYDLDINLIESITILKDASATAMYGSRGANGIIVVERKKPKAGKLRFGYSGSFTVALPDFHDYNLMNATEKLQTELVAGIYSPPGTDDRVTQKMLYNERDKQVLEGRNTYWLNLPVRNTLAQQHSINISGGSENVTYGVDFSYNKNNGVMKGSDRTSYNGGISLTYRSRKYQVTNYLGLAFTNATNSAWGSFSQYARMNPYFSPYDQTGNIGLYLQHQTVTDAFIDSYRDIYNPMYNTLLNGKDFGKSKNVSNNTSVTFNFTPSLSLRGSFSITSQNDDNEIFLPSGHTTYLEAGTPLADRGAYTAGYGKGFSYDASVDLNYSLNRRKTQFYFTLNARASESKFENIIIQVKGLPSPLTNQVYYGRVYDGDRPGGSEGTTRTAGFMGNANYSYDNRFFTDFSFRLDGASNVGINKLFTPFWSAGIGWNLHNEKFMQSLFKSGVISQIKIRGSVGLTGAQNVEPYMAARTYNYALNDFYNNNIGATIINIGNKDLTWQGTFKRNVGVDIATWKDRITVTGNYFYDYTDKFISQFNLPLSTGFATYSGNLGAIANNGWDISMGVQVIKPHKDDGFGLMLSANTGHVTSIIKKISAELKAQNALLENQTDGSKPFSRFEEGATLDAVWVVPSLGIDPATGKELFLKKDGTATFDYDPNDVVSAGHSTPKFSGTMAINMAYKNFTFSCYSTFNVGGVEYNQTLADKIENVNLVDNADRRVLAVRWKKPGDIAFFKSINITGAGTRPTSRFVEKDNTLQMTSFSLLYHFSQAYLKRIGLKGLNLALYTNNLIRISSIKMERGIDYPFARSYSLSIQPTF